MFLYICLVDYIWFVDFCRKTVLALCCFEVLIELLKISRVKPHLELQLRLEIFN